MKIIFLCGSLEPGRDGVGDYTRQLASELILNGHQAGIVAINDQHITDKFEGVQNLGSVSLRVLRLPSHIPALHRFKQARLWIDNFDPEWLSLQFVPFAFHPKGLPFQMGKLLTTLTGDRRWHIMVHELWVGMNKESSLKFFWWGVFQRQLIKALFNKVMPAMGQLYVGWTSPGEWINYSIEVKKTGLYKIATMYTSNGNGAISFDIDNKPATGALMIPSTHNDADTVAWRQWHHWNRVDSLTSIYISKGKHVLTLHIVQQGQMNFDYFEFKL